MATNNIMINANSLVSRHNGAKVASALRVERASISSNENQIGMGFEWGFDSYQPENSGLRAGGDHGMT